jgi:hypothetical protein
VNGFLGDGREGGGVWLFKKLKWIVVEERKGGRKEGGKGVLSKRRIWMC